MYVSIKGTEPEVNEFDPHVFWDQDILKFKISMHNIIFMQIC